MLCCWLRPTKPQTASTPSSAAVSNVAQHEVDLLLADRRIVVQQVVEVADVREADAGGLDRRLDTRWRARLSNGWRRSSVLATGSSIASGGTSALGRMERRRQLDVVRAELARELQPLLDGAIGIGVAHLARRQLLQRRREDADFHELRFEGCDRHGLQCYGLRATGSVGVRACSPLGPVAR